MYPSTDSSYWKSILLYNDVVTIEPGDPHRCTLPCFYTVAVIPWGSGSGSGATSFTLTADTQSVITLFDAVQVRDQLLKLQSHFYRYTPLPGISSVTITVSPSVGIVSVYITTGTAIDKQYPDRTNAATFNKALNGVGELTATITAADSWFCGTVNQTGSTGVSSCSYLIAVYASTVPNNQPALFTISATSASVNSSTSIGSTQPVLLTNSAQSTLFNAVQGSWSYYYLTLVGPDASLSLTLTSITGDCDLYYLYSDNSATLYPSSSNFNSSAESTSAIDIILIEPAKAGYYWLAVNAFQTSTYRLSASIYNESTLVDGVPLSAIVQQYAYKYYNFTVSNTTARLTVTLFKSVGEPDLYIASPQFLIETNTLPNRTHYTWASVTYYTDVVTIDDPEPGMYVIAVYGFETTLYTISASTSEASRQLREGISQAGNLTRDSSDYYQIAVDRINIALTVIVTVLSGDCDLYLSAVETQPGEDNFNGGRTPIPDFLSISYGHDGITVPTRYLAVGQYWYAGVSAFSSCTYSISYKLGSTETLQDGKPQGGTVTKNAYRYYRFSITADQPYILTISATPFFGTVSMFVISSATDKGHPAAGQMLEPSAANNDIASNAFETSPVIVIQPGDAAYCSYGGLSNCTYWIAVQGTSSAAAGSNYTMVVRSNRTNTGATLQDGVPTDGYLAAGQYEWYRFVQNFAAGAVLFAVTPRDVQSDPDLYLSCSSANTQPTSIVGTYDVSSAASGGDVIHVDSATDSACWVGTYYIGVYAGSGRPAQYSMLAQAYSVGLDWREITHIITNQPYTGLVTTTNITLQWRYYRYYPLYNASSPDDLTITLTATYGDPDMYVTANATALPSASNSFAASTSIAGGSIIIPGASVCPSCYYTIGVVAFTPALYQLMVTTAPQTIQLTAGRPYRSRVAELASRMFVVSFVDHTDLLTITVTSISGDADVYCSTYPNVSTSNKEWSSISVGTDVISIPNAAPTTYYILVYGFYAAEFTIVAQLGATELLAGIPQRDFLTAGEYRLYAVWYGEPPGSPSLTFSVTSTNGFRFVNLYVSDNVYPDSSNAMWSNVYTNQTDEYGNFNLVTIGQPSNKKKYYLRVEAIYSVQYDVTASYGGSSTVLSAGRFTVDSVQEGQCNQYIAYVSASTNQALPDVSLDFIESIGDVQMWVDFRGPPNATYFNLTTGNDPTSRTGHVGVDTSQLGLTPSSGGTLTIYVAVCGVSASTYSLSYSTHSIYLPINQPLSARTPDNTSQPLYFFVQSQVTGVSQVASLQLTIIGTAADGSQDAWSTAQYTVYACNDQVEVCVVRGVVQPSASLSAWNTTITNGQSWTLPLPSTLVTIGPTATTGTYVLAVYSSVGGLGFVIQVLQRNGSRMLADGERVIGEVLELSSPHSTDYYQTRVALSNTASQVQIDRCQGNAQVYISDTNVFPSSSNAKVGVTLPTDGSAVQYLPSRNGQFFIAVTPLATAPQLVYDIQVYTGGRPSLAYFDFSNRSVSAQQDNNGNLRVSVQTATVLPTVAALGAVMQYVVYWAPFGSDQSNFDTPCGCNLVANAPATSQSGAAVMLSPASLDPVTIYSEIPNLPAGVQYKVGVVARLVQAAYASDFLTPASFEQAAASTIGAQYFSGGADSGTLAAIAIPVVLTVVAAFAYLLYRNRQLKRELAGVEMQDVPRGQVIKAAGGGGFRARAAAKLSRGGGNRKARTRYSQLLGMGGPASDEAGGRELSTNELGLDEEDVDVDMEDGVYNSSADGAGNVDDEQRYTLDLEQEENEHKREEDVLGLRVC